VHFSCSASSQMGAFFFAQIFHNWLLQITWEGLSNSRFKVSGIRLWITSEASKIPIGYVNASIWRSVVVLPPKLLLLFCITKVPSESSCCYVVSCAEKQTAAAWCSTLMRIGSFDWVWLLVLHMWDMITIETHIPGIGRNHVHSSLFGAVLWSFFRL